MDYEKGPERFYPHLTYPEEKELLWLLCEGAWPEPRGPLSSLGRNLERATMLRIFGHPDLIEEEAERVHQVYEDTILRGFALGVYSFTAEEAKSYAQGRLFELQRGLQAREGELIHLYERVSWAWRDLIAEGWRYDFDKAMAYRKTAGRPRSIYREAVELLAAEFAPKVLGGGDLPSEPVREEIASRLRLYFHPDLTNTHSSRKLYQTIRNIRDAHK